MLTHKSKYCNIQSNHLSTIGKSFHPDDTQIPDVLLFCKPLFNDYLILL